MRSILNPPRNSIGSFEKNATQRHGVTRFRVGRNAVELRTEDVETIDLHPHLLNENWEDYARFVLYHEYLHVGESVSRF